MALEHHDIYVIELSSFQLDNMYDFKADIAVIMNITPDHLDRYDHKMENYVAAKFRILQNRTKDDYFIYWQETPWCAAGYGRYSPRPYADAVQRDGASRLGGLRR